MTMVFQRFPEVRPLPFPMQPSPGLYARHMKPAVDKAIVLASVPVVVPAIAILAAVVALDGGAPFCRQERVGQGGRVFRVWTLRSKSRTTASEHGVTATGRYLRRSSLDELPLLWNVLTGDMSLVGPRPLLPAQTVFYPGRAYAALRPGVMGYWQTAGRDRTTFAARAECDATYAASLSLGNDLRLMWRAVSAALRGAVRG